MGYGFTEPRPTHGLRDLTGRKQTISTDAFDHPRINSFSFSMVSRSNLSESLLDSLIYHSSVYAIGTVENFPRMIFELSKAITDDDVKLLTQIQRLELFISLIESRPPMNGFAINPRKYIQLTLEHGLSFTTWLKKARSVAVVLSLSRRRSSSCLARMEKLNQNPYGFRFDPDKRYDYDSFIHESYLPFWEETANDFVWAFKPVEIKSEALLIYKEQLRSLLLEYKTEVKIPRPAEILDWKSDSVTYLEGEKTTVAAAIRSDTATNLMELLGGDLSRPARFYRGIVPVAPGNIRDTWQCEYETLKRVKYQSYLLRQIVEKLPFSAMTSSDRLRSRLDRVYNESQEFLMLDFKKCGLTIPRALIQATGEVLQSVYPGCGFEVINMYHDAVTVNGETEFVLNRGTGLGNFNEGITLIQSVLGFILKNKFDINSIFFNDDGVIACPHSQRAVMLFSLGFWDSLGMILNHEKTIRGHDSVFCENYQTECSVDYSKRFQLIWAYCNLFFLRERWQVKQNLLSLSRMAIHSDFLFDEKPLYYHYGYEFSVGELHWPIEFGGWIGFRDDNVSDALFSLYDFNHDRGSHTRPVLRSWVRWLSGKNEISSLGFGSQTISYRTETLPSFIDTREVFRPDDVLEVLDQIGVHSVKVDELRYRSFNLRGLKNSKPQISEGLGRKSSIARKKLWRRYSSDVRNNRGELFILEQSQFQVRILLAQLKQIGPKNFLPPFFMWEQVYILKDNSRKPKGRFLFQKYKQIEEHSRYGQERLYEYLLTGTWNRGVDILGSEKMASNNFPSTFESRNEIWVTNSRGAPSYAKEFLCSKRRFDAVFLSRYGFVVRDDFQKYSSRESNCFSLKEVINRLPGPLKGFCRKILKTSKDLIWLRDFVSLLSREDINNSAFLQESLNVYLESFKDDSQEEDVEFEFESDDDDELYDFIRETSNNNWGHEYTDLVDDADLIEVGSDELFPENEENPWDDSHLLLEEEGDDFLLDLEPGEEYHSTVARRTAAEEY